MTTADGLINVVADERVPPGAVFLVSHKGVVPIVNIASTIDDPRFREIKRIAAEKVK